MNPDYFNKASNNIGSLHNLKIELNKSPDALYGLHNFYGDLIFDKNVVFWLDAHWYSSPLNDEIYHITKNYNKFTIFIDDFVIPFDNRFRNDGFNIEQITPYINNKNKLKIYMPSYNSFHPDCCNNPSSQPVGYCIITTENIDTFGFLTEIKI